jgi:hypothetical protein
MDFHNLVNNQLMKPIRNESPNTKPITQEELKEILLIVKRTHTTNPLITNDDWSYIL